MKKLLLLLSLVPLMAWSQTCGPGLGALIVTIVPDTYPQETSWEVHDASGNLLGSGGSVGDTLCVPTGGCYAFTIYDSYGDGICCAYGAGSYTVSWNGTAVASGGSFAFNELTWFNCSPGQGCSNPLVVDTGAYSFSGSAWYSFVPDTVGTYRLSACQTGNSCAAQIWVYDQCDPLVLATGVAGALSYSNSSAACATQGELDMVMSPGNTYLIRLAAACSTGWSLTYLGPVVGCMDSTSCNFNPLATISSGNCLYYPDPNCPDGPDLLMVQSAFENSLVLDTVTATNCAVQENCLTGYGDRLVLRFDTHIKNIGGVDYFIGNPATHPNQFNFANCHGHAHYEGYAEYVLYQMNGYALPIGFKNGFCVLDLECSGGGTGKYDCGNQGITAGCGDIYGAYLDCQWIDLTDVADGDYILATKVNWDQSPDALGRIETDYTNNWAQVCITLSTDSNGVRSFVRDTACPVYTDCLGVPYGNARVDCQGVCGGSALDGDLNANGSLEASDFNGYTQGILNGSLGTGPCRDLTGDGLLDIWDVMWLQECLAHGGTGYSCQFPRGLENPYQPVQFRLGAYDAAAGTVLVEVNNPNPKLAGVQLELSGAEVVGWYPALGPVPGAMAFYTHTNGRLLGISPSGQAVEKSTNWQPLVTLQLGNVLDAQLCLSQAVAVNASLERVDAGVDTLCFATGLEVSNWSEQGLKVYPNPTQGKVEVKLEHGVIESLVLYDIRGVQVKIESVPPGRSHAALDMENYPPGFYVLEVMGANELFRVSLIKK